MLVLGVVSGEGAVVQKKLGLAFCGKRLGADWLGGTVSEDRHLHCVISLLTHLLLSAPIYVLVIISYIYST